MQIRNLELETWNPRAARRLVGHPLLGIPDETDHDIAHLAGIFEEAIVHALVKKMQLGAIDNRTDGVVKVDAQLIGSTGIIESPDNQGRALQAACLDALKGFTFHWVVPPSIPKPGVLLHLFRIVFDPLRTHPGHPLLSFLELGKQRDPEFSLNIVISDVTLLVRVGVG